jgi:hypothetical protein
MTGFQMFSRCNTKWSFIIASWHSPHSMTWRWCFYWHRLREGERRFSWKPLHWGPSNGNGIEISFLVPWTCLLRFVTQPPMWYRDHYSRLVDENGELMRAVNLAKSNASYPADGLPDSGPTTVH